MGQMTVGIMLGVHEPDGVEMLDEEHFEAGLLDRWRRVVETSAFPFSVRVPELENDGDPPRVGFWICVGATGRDGLPRLLDLRMPLAQVRTDPRYESAYRAARRRWVRFARWAHAQGVELGNPRLMRVDTEVA